MTSLTSLRLLRLTLYGALCFAFTWFTVAVPGVDSAGLALLDMLDWPPGTNSVSPGRHVRWLSGVGAGLFVGMVLLCLLVVLPELAKGNLAVRRGTLLALGGWFIVDSAGSVIAGVPSNAIFNLMFLLLLVVPLLSVQPR